MGEYLGTMWARFAIQWGTGTIGCLEGRLWVPWGSQVTKSSFLGCSCGFLGDLGGSLGGPGVVSGVSWGVLSVPWRCLGAFMGLLKTIWASIWEPCGHGLRSNGVPLGPLRVA